MNDHNISIINIDGNWHAHFFYVHSISRELIEHTEDTRYKANSIFKRKARAVAKKILSRINATQHHLQRKLGKPQNFSVESCSVECPDVLNDKGKPMNLIKEINGYWYMYFSYTKTNGKYARCRKTTKLVASRANKPKALRMALATRNALLQHESEILEPPQSTTTDNSSQASVNNTSVDATFAQVADDYVKTLQAKGLKKSTLKSYLSILKNHLLPEFGNTPIPQITTRSIDRWFATLKGVNKKPLSGKTRNNIINFLAEIMSKAVAWEYCKENPVKHISRSRLTETEMLFWSKEERDLFLSTASKHSPTFFPMFATFLFTGMRVGEIIALKWEHIDLTTSTIHVQENYVENELTVPKSGKSRFIQICPFLQELLLKYQQNTKTKGLVFPTRHGNYSTNDRIRRPFERLVELANVTKIRMHDMRHTFASLALMDGVDVPTVQKWLGHKDIQTTMRYIKLLPEHMQEQSKKLNPNLVLDQLY